MTRVRLSIADQEQTFELSRQGERVHVGRDDRSIEVRVVYQDDATMLLEYVDADNLRHTIAVAGAVSGDQRHLWVDGRNLTVKRLRGQTAAAGPVDGSLSSSIPAVVSQLLVSTGDPVQAGDKLLLLESMKMVIPIQSPVDGVVTAINCVAGESIAAGVPLVEITPDES